LEIGHDHLNTNFYLLTVCGHLTVSFDAMYVISAVETLSLNSLMLAKHGIIAKISLL